MRLIASIILLLIASGFVIARFDRIDTNVEISADVDNLVVHRLLHEGVNVVVNIRHEVRIFNRTFWLEMQALIGVLVLLGAMLLLDALNPRLPNATVVELPPPLPEPAADEVIPPNPQLFPPPFAPEMQVQALSGEAVQQALEAAHPELVTADSPTQRVSERPVDGFEPLTRRYGLRAEPTLLVPSSTEGKDRLYASLLDARRTFDRLVMRYAPDNRARRERAWAKEAPGPWPGRGRQRGSGRGTESEGEDRRSMGLPTVS